MVVCAANWGHCNTSSPLYWQLRSHLQVLCTLPPAVIAYQVEVLDQMQQKGEVALGSLDSCSWRLLDSNPGRPPRELRLQQQPVRACLLPFTLAMRFVHAMWRCDTPLAEYKHGRVGMIIMMRFQQFVTGRTQPRQTVAAAIQRMRSGATGNKYAVPA